MEVGTLCPSCGGTLVPGAGTCGSCGMAVTRCVGCGRPLAPADRFCGNCGTPQAAAAAEVSPWDEVADRLRAATLGDFEIMGELGRGGMAAVYRAHEIALDRKVAIKVMAPGLLMGAGMVERFRQEAVTVANLHHPNIVTIHAVRQAQGLHFFVMRLVEGRSLERVIRTEGPLPVPVVQAWLYQVGAALGYAHRHGVIHRDIKPANILLDSFGSAIVTDFGIAKVASAPGLTMTGATVGTPAYMSPEQCWSHELTGASDQYSLGIVAYEMLTGAPPFSGPTLSVLRAHTEEEPPPLRDARPDCPPSVADAVARMLAKDPEARWPTIIEAATALGGRPLLGNEPLCAALEGLARPDGEAPVRAIAVTPRSPIPASGTLPRQGADAPTVLPPTVPEPTPPSVPTVEAPTALPAAAITPKPVSSTPPEEHPELFAPTAISAVPVEPAELPTIIGPPPAVAAPGAESVPDEQVGEPPTDEALETEPTPAVLPPVEWRTSPESLLDVPLQTGSAAAPPREADVSEIRVAVQPNRGSVDSALHRLAPVLHRLRHRAEHIPRLVLGSAAALVVVAVGAIVVMLLRPASAPVARKPEPAIRAQPETPSVSTDAQPVHLPEGNPPRAERAGGAVASLTVGRAPHRIVVGDTFSLEATPIDSGGLPVSQPVAWRSNQPRVATISEGGRIMAVGPGAAVLTISAGGVSRSVPITVLDSARSVAVSDGRKPTTPEVSERPPAPPTAPPPSAAGAALTIAAGGATSCASSAAGLLSCWGADPLRATSSPGAALTRLGLGDGFGCGLADNGRAYCWGSNGKGQLGDGSSRRHPIPTLVTPDLAFTELAVGATHVCAITSGSNLYCWGDNGSGQLGDGSRSGRGRPTQISETQPWRHVTAGRGHTCALTTAGAAFCWGDGFSGELGQGMQQNEPAPVPVAGGITFHLITAGDRHTCAVAVGGRVYCWGDNRAGQLGDGRSADESRPVPVAGTMLFEQVAAGADHTCGLSSGRVYCWGADDKGQLGDRGGHGSSSPKPVPIDGRVVRVSAGANHSCALTDAGRAVCWGANEKGQSGQPPAQRQASPAVIPFP